MMDKKHLVFVREAGAIVNDLPAGPFREAVEQYTADVELLRSDRPDAWFEAERNAPHVKAITEAFDAYGAAPDVDKQDKPTPETAPVLEALAEIRKDIAALREADAPDEAPEQPDAPEAAADDSPEDEPEGEGEEA